MKIVSFNINGIRAAIKKGLLDYLLNESPDIVGFQEIRATLSQIDEKIFQIGPYYYQVVSAQRPGYSGVALLAKFPPDKIITKLGITKFDCEGRFVAMSFGSLWVINCYFPNGSGKESDNSRVPYKLEFYDAIMDFIATLKGEIILLGDLNTAHHEIDIARSKENKNNSGFLDVEREKVSQMIDFGMVDTFRYFNPKKIQYSWWSMRGRARANNVGWRIDYILANQKSLKKINRAFIEDHVKISDHCPVGVHYSK